MSIGISTACFYPELTENALRTLGEMGVRDVEIFFNARCETQEPFLSELNAIRRAYGIRVRAVHPYYSSAESYTLFGRYPRRFEDGRVRYMELCEACHALDCDLLVLHGEREPLALSASEYIERFGTLAAQTAEQGVRLSQENVVRFRSASSAFLREMADALGDLFCMTLDVKQAYRSGEDALALAEMFGDRIVHLHLNDHGEAGDCLPVGAGSFDFESLFRVLDSRGFTGSAVVELYRASYTDAVELLQSVENAKKFRKKALQNAQ